MTTFDEILGQFIDAWNAGQRPDVDAYLARAAEKDRPALAGRLATWLEIAPTPDYDESAMAAITQEPALRAAMEGAALSRSPLSERLPTLRGRAGLAVGDVARRLVAIFDLDDERRVTEYLERVERDDLDAGRLSRRLTDALASILGADPAVLAPRRAGLAGGQSFFRADDDSHMWIAQDIDALSRAALAPAPEPMDELDRLFLGGPDG